MHNVLRNACLGDTRLGSRGEIQLQIICLNRLIRYDATKRGGLGIPQYSEFCSSSEFCLSDLPNGVLFFFFFFCRHGGHRSKALARKHGSAYLLQSFSTLLLFPNSNPVHSSGHQFNECTMLSNPMTLRRFEQRLIRWD